MAIRLQSKASAYVLAVTLGWAALPTGADAQTASIGAASSVSWSKSQAILGAPSALQGILAQQGAALAAPTVPQPAAYLRPRIIPAVLRDRPAPSEGVVSGRPDLFGSVALKVAHTPLDERWRGAERARLGGVSAAYAGSLRDLGAEHRLEAVNRYVNRRVRFTDDARRFGRDDVWSSARDTLRSGRGDCEDYAIAKLQMLRLAGFSDRDLYLVIVRDLVRRADHAVLAVRASGHMFVLDNGSDDVLDSESISDYRPVFTFAADGEWTHGYRMQHAPVTIAAAAPPTPVVLASNDQRSRSASLLAFSTGFIR